MRPGMLDPAGDDPAQRALGHVELQPDAAFSVFRRSRASAAGSGRSNDQSRRCDQEVRPRSSRAGPQLRGWSGGRSWGFWGPNGAGKTTTMKMITGTLQPDEGEILFDGEPISEQLTEAKRRGRLPARSEPALRRASRRRVPGLRRRAEGNVCHGDARRRRGRGGRDRPSRDVFYRPIGECSKGYRQRIGLGGRDPSPAPRS